MMEDDEPRRSPPEHIAARYDAPDVAGDYVRSQQQGTRPWRHRRQEQRIVSGFLEEFREDLVVLDIPCGTGRYLPSLGRFRRVLGMDGSESMLARARSVAGTPGVALLKADAFHLPLSDDAVDLAVCMRFLHHLEARDDLRACLRELARVTRRALICSFFDRRSIQHVRRRLGRRRKRSSRYALSQGEMVALLSDCGFRVRRTRHVARWWSETCVLLCDRER